MKNKLLTTLASSALILSATALIASEPEQGVKKEVKAPTTTKAAPMTPPVETKAPTDKKEAQATQWGYEGAGAPENWGKLSPKFSICAAGRNQSPIDIKNTVDADLPPINFKYNMLSPADIINDGHTVQVNLWSGGEITLDGEQFTLKQFNFHTPSENTIDGKKFPLEMQLVHLNKKNEIAIVSILFEPGKDDDLLTTLWKNIPLKAGESHKLDAKALKTMEFESKLNSYYRFNGSLTTPPCTEGVRWIVMKNTRHVSQAQVLAFQKALTHSNNRPVQAMNARVIVE